MHHLRSSPLLAALLLALSAGTALAQPRSADTVYQQELAACRAGSTVQDRATCLKEAGAARAEARRHGLDNGETAAQLRANALLRCQRVNDDQRAACERLAQGEGTRNGSVAEGAVLKQITTRGAAAAPAAAASR